ncbi:MAG: hypothetical protein V3W06_03750 [Acidimicrobiia bacterium]
MSSELRVLMSEDLILERVGYPIEALQLLDDAGVKILHYVGGQFVENVKKGAHGDATLVVSQDH